MAVEGLLGEATSAVEEKVRKLGAELEQSWPLGPRLVNSKHGQLAGVFQLQIPAQVAFLAERRMSMTICRAGEVAATYLP